MSKTWSHEDLPDGYFSVGEEVGFSWSQCDLCGSSLGGNRHTVYQDREEYGNACDDCVIFIANGECAEGCTACQK